VHEEYGYHLRQLELQPQVPETHEKKLQTKHACRHFCHHQLQNPQLVAQVVSMQA
jgi:hypothetical protein